MAPFTFILQPYSTGKNTRFTCPACSKKHQFTLYLNAETLEPISSKVGICNRQSKCGYHYTPKQYFQENKHLTNYSPQINRKIHPTPFNQPSNKPKQPASFIPTEVFKKSRKYYDRNNFTIFLEKIFGTETTNKVICLYHIGTSKKWPGATIFWQIDQTGKVRTGKIMLYNTQTGKRIKEPISHLNWVHKSVGIEPFYLKQCLFGEHLLTLFPNKPVAIVESEKTAIICSLYLPKFIWLAVGGLTMLSKERCAGLKGRNVTLFPDLNGYEKWCIKANELSSITNFKVANILQTIANEKQTEEGLDLADFLLKMEVKQLKFAQ